jgi:hypothetical protein
MFISCPERLAFYMRVSMFLVGAFLVCLSGTPIEISIANGQTLPGVSLEKVIKRRYESLRTQYQDMTYPELISRLGAARNYAEALPFKPTQAKYFELVQSRLRITDQEQAMFERNGFVTIDQRRGLSFPAAYQQIYTSDLPVFITTDSILHALHRSYDEILKELETTYFRSEIDEILAGCQKILARRKTEALPEIRDSLQDTDLFVGVARKLLHTPPKSMQEELAKGLPPRFFGAAIANRVSPSIAYSVMGQDATIDTVIAKIDALQLESTKIYGGERFVDYSQFRPRGHYTESLELASYFRCLMWLGRADCGWVVCPEDHTQQSLTQSRRELRNAVLLTELLHESGGTSRLNELDSLIKYLVGRSDNFGVSQLTKLLRTSQIRSMQELINFDTIDRLQQSIAADPANAQLIRSEVLVPVEGPKPSPLPIRFQLFGQRFAIDSYFLSKVVHDEIIYQGDKKMRLRPTGLDVMATLGNDEATVLLESELDKWKYSANLMACREVAKELDAGFWEDSLYHAWVDSLRSLDANTNGEPNTPSAFKTRAWQRKQLQTQLASWAELRRDNILYVKQSYSVFGCAFPCGYVEPYPEFYAKLKRMADNAGRMLAERSPTSNDKDKGELLLKNCERQVAFFQEMSRSMRMLEDIARSELRGEPLESAQREFLRGTFDDSGKLKFGSATVTDFSGWYSRLYYGRHQDPTHWSPMERKPVVADVHTSPEDLPVVLEAATGEARLMLIAIDGPKNATVYVGPVSSYYEFWQPAEQRLTDEEWRKRLATDPPPRPIWVTEFEADSIQRLPEKRVTALRRENQFMFKIENASSTMGVSIETLRYMAKEPTLHSLDLSNSEIDDSSLRPLSNLPDLRSLNLSGTKITDACSARLKEYHHLQFLDLSATAITDAILPSLTDLVYLSQIDLRCTQVTDSGVRELRRQMTDTDVLH